jgi:hypothetical protein
MVAALGTATDKEPQVAGKPSPVLLADARSRGDFDACLVIGDRLDTDIAGAHAAGLPSLLVLCGVNTAEDAIWASPQQRPDYLAADLRALTADSDTLRVAPHPGWEVGVDSARVTVRATGEDSGDALAVVRAIAAAVWASDQRRSPIRPVDDTAREAVARWSLAPADID